MTPLADLLVRRIRAQGPITIADYMAECLFHPRQGYYATRDPFGRKGDFTTAPEISQMFGELVGLFLAQCWMDQGQPGAFTLAELGPGRGTMMADILRATRIVPGFHQAARVVLVEASPTLRRVQRATLDNVDVQWADHAPELPEAPLFLVANEFFDALPIRQFQRTVGGWAERLVTEREGVLSLALSGRVAAPDLQHRLGDTRAGDIVETCTPAAPVMSEVSRRLERHGGVALIIDYGDWRSLGDTLQALRDHRPESPFANPGQADLTAHVDFEALATAASGVTATPMTPQGVFLERLGIAARARTLAEKLRGDALQSHLAAYRRLTHPHEMGTLFKAIAFYASDAPTPPGFSE